MDIPSEQEVRISGLMSDVGEDEGVDEVIRRIEIVLVQLKDKMVKISRRPGGKAILDRALTYLKCWTGELGE